MLFAVVLVAATAALIGSLAYTRACRALEREARTRLAIIARDIAQGLDRDIADRTADVTSWAHLAVMRAVMYDDVDKELAQFIRQIVTGGQAYVGILCLDAAGRPVAAAGRVAAAVASAGNQQNVAVSSPVRVSLVAGTEDLGQLLQLETPIFDPERGEQAIGTLLVLVEPRRLLHAAETGLGSGGHHLAFEVRERGDHRTIVRVADRTPEPDVQGFRHDDAAPLVRAAAVRQTLVDGDQLEVVVSEPVDEALVAVTALRLALLRRVSLVLVLGAALGGLVAWRIGAPIRRLTETVREITERGSPASDWNFRASAGEVGVLASAFRAMMERLSVAQAEAVMQSRLALLGEIAANVAHEVRTPLSTLKTSAQLLARRELPLAEQRELATAVTEEVDRLNVVVTDLVDLARPKRASYRLESLPDIVRRAEAFFAPAARKQRVQLVEQIEADVPRFHGSADQIYQVLLNLVHNALQAASSPGRIVIRCRRDAEWIVLEIEDSGPGFAPEILSKAFTRFCTTKPDGTGLGLAVSRRIVEEHGGTIVAENMTGGGARVRLRLRAREDV
jgi:signal transduction histidine kinase